MLNKNNLMYIICIIFNLLKSRTLLNPQILIIVLINSMMNWFFIKGDPMVIKGDPMVIKGDPMIINGDPMVINGDPMVINGDPMVINGDPDRKSTRLNSSH